MASMAVLLKTQKINFLPKLISLWASYLWYQWYWESDRRVEVTHSSQKAEEIMGCSFCFSCCFFDSFLLLIINIFFSVILVVSFLPCSILLSISLFYSFLPSLLLFIFSSLRKYNNLPASKPPYFLNGTFLNLSSFSFRSRDK